MLAQFGRDANYSVGRLAVPDRVVCQFDWAEIGMLHFGHVSVGNYLGVVSQLLQALYRREDEVSRRVQNLRPSVVGLLGECVIQNLDQFPSILSSGRSVVESRVVHKVFQAQRLGEGHPVAVCLEIRQHDPTSVAAFVVVRQWIVGVVAGRIRAEIDLRVGFVASQRPHADGQALEPHGTGQMRDIHPLSDAVDVSGHQRS